MKPNVSTARTLSERLYADTDDDSNYDQLLGYWTFASFHADLLEGQCHEQFGYSENGRNYTRDHLEAAGFTVNHDAYNVYNSGFFWAGSNTCGDPKNLWVANGKADKVHVP